MANKVTLQMGATIPAGQYANVQPVVTVEAGTFDEAKVEALRQIKSIWDAAGTVPFDPTIDGEVSTAAPVKYEVQTCAATGAEVLFDPIAHKYVDKDGNKYLSGSAFCGKYKSEFDREGIAKAFADKHKVDVNDVLAMWQLNGDTSTSFGTSVHNALELYGKYLQLSKQTKGTSESALHKNPVLKAIVESFYKGREDEVAYYEPFVASEKYRLCGFIDRLLVVDKAKKIVRVQDYKTSPKINKRETILEPFKKVVDATKLGAYWLQLSFYAFILEEAGYTVEGLDIFNFDGEKWVTYSSDVIDVAAEAMKWTNKK